MTALLLLLLATRLAMSGANRLKLNPAFAPKTMITGPVMQQGRLHRNSPPHLPHPQMQVAAPSFDDSHIWSNLSSMIEPAWVAYKGGRGTHISKQKFPPTEIDGLDARKLLHAWEEMADVRIISSARAAQGSSYFKDKAKVLHSMQTLIARVTQLLAGVDEDTVDEVEWNEPEIVGLVPKGSEIEFLESGSSEVGAHVDALAVFSHGQIRDDEHGSLHSFMASRSRDLRTQHWSGRPKKQFHVLEIEGLADASGLSEHSARVLLSKIEAYARKDNNIVVVSPRSLGEEDLTEYYVSLGFEKVMMEDSSYELVFMGSPSPASNVPADDEQIMVGMSLWAGIDEP